MMQAPKPKPQNLISIGWKILSELNPTTAKKERDWLGRKPESGPDWLGRKPKSGPDWLGRK